MVIVVFVIMSLVSIWVTQRQLERGTLQSGPPAAEDPARTSTPTPTITPTFTPDPDGIDYTLPQLQSVEFEVVEVNTTSSSQVLTLTAHITDDLSGLQRAQLRFQPGPGGTQYLDFFIDSSKRISGDRNDGIYLTTATLPKYAQHGRWILIGMFLADQANNNCTSSIFDASGPDYDNCLFVSDYSYFVNGTDSGLPIVTEPIDGELGPTPRLNQLYMPALGE